MFRQWMLVGLLVWLVPICYGQDSPLAVYETDDLKIERLSANTFVHISYLDTKTYGKVACNGMLIVNDGEAVVFDTPTTEKASAELIAWIRGIANSKVKAVIATHFHEDCLGGVKEFHREGILSYASNQTIELLRKNKLVLPKKGFEKYMQLTVGDKKVICEHPSAGHTIDNVIGYFPFEEIMFGGCLVKSVGAGKGNLQDANVHEWPKTIQKLKEKYNTLKWVVPGHGLSGGPNLLEYTIQLFKNQ